MEKNRHIDSFPKETWPNKFRRMLGGENFEEKNALDYEWPVELCLDLKMEIEEKPKFIDTEELIETIYSKLIDLLGAPATERPSRQIDFQELKQRIIFTSNDVIKAFQYFYERPGQDSEKYWESPYDRIGKTVPEQKASTILSSAAMTLPIPRVIFVSNESQTLKGKELAYLQQNKINKDDHDRLYVKWETAHELVHFYYSDELSLLYGLK